MIFLHLSENETEDELSGGSLSRGPHCGFFTQKYLVLANAGQCTSTNSMLVYINDNWTNASFLSDK